MFTTASLIANLRPALRWAIARMATSPVGSLIASRVVGFDPCRVPAPVPIPLPRRPRAMAAVMASALATLTVLPQISLAAPGFESVADGRLVDVQVQVEGKGMAPLYFAKNRFDRHYFQAFQGRNYSLVLRNTTNRRVGVLIAVDGLNVVNGQRSSLSRNESMYVLDPYERTVVRGWRTSLNSIRKFVFVDEQRSYAERTGQANGDMGWIRVLAFREQRPGWDHGGKIREPRWDGDDHPYDDRGELQGRGAAPEMAKPEAETFEGAPQKRMYADEQNSNPGTGWGEHSHDRVNRTVFHAEARPVDQIVLRYEYASGLRALGIRIVHPSDRLWERERGEMGFAQPPRW